MAITYHLTGKTNNESKGVSGYFWELIRPLLIRDVNDQTQYLLGTVKHPITGEEAIVVDSEYELYNFTINPATQDEDVDTKTQQLEDIGVITAQEKASIRSAVKSLKGQSVSVLDLLPARYKTAPNVKTYEEMVADGWFTTEELVR